MEELDTEACRQFSNPSVEAKGQLGWLTYSGYNCDCGKKAEAGTQLTTHGTAAAVEHAKGVLKRVEQVIVVRGRLMEAPQRRSTSSTKDPLLAMANKDMLTM
eukprot:3996771-Amphidinium_carterae.1